MLTAEERRRGGLAAQERRRQEREERRRRLEAALDRALEQVCATLLELALDPEVEPATRVRAAREVLDRLVGRPSSVVVDAEEQPAVVLIQSAFQERDEG